VFTAGKHTENEAYERVWGSAPLERNKMSQLKIMFIGAHPDDIEVSCAGTAIKFAQKGHIVQILSATNGQSGHHEIMGQKLVDIRTKEAQESQKRMGIHSYVILDNNDAYLTADIHSRERMIKAIRDFAPNIIITHRLNDYHPDHRITAQLVQDCSYLVRVPNFLPGTPIPDVMPVIFYMNDHFMKPTPLDPEIVVDIDDVADAKLNALDAHTSQVYQWLPWISGNLHKVPTDPKERIEFLRNAFGTRWANTANRFRSKLIEKYGNERGSKIKYAEAFEASEYGGYHDIEVEKKLFTFD